MDVDEVDIVNVRSLSNSLSNSSLNHWCARATASENHRRYVMLLFVRELFVDNKQHSY